LKLVQPLPEWRSEPDLDRALLAQIHQAIVVAWAREGDLQ
jgi:hypothetical protein